MTTKKVKTETKVQTTILNFKQVGSNLIINVENDTTVLTYRDKEKRDSIKNQILDLINKNNKTSIGKLKTLLKKEKEILTKKVDVVKELAKLETGLKKSKNSEATELSVEQAKAFLEKEGYNVTAKTTATPRRGEY
jgi:hypothetical protein